MHDGLSRSSPRRYSGPLTAPRKARSVSRGEHLMIFNDSDRVAALTPQNPFGRLEDGRSATPDDLIERLKLVTNDEAWGVLERRNNYHFQFEGGWPVHLQPGVPLTGRAVTAQYVPIRPDLNDVVQSIGASEGRSGGQNTWIIDQLQPGDVLVVDLFGKIEDCLLYTSPSPRDGLLSRM